MASDNLKGRRNRGSAFSKRAALRKRAIADQETPPTEGPHPLYQDIATDLLVGGGMSAGRLGGQAARGGAKMVMRAGERRMAARAAAAASERRLAEMAAPRATRNFTARGGGLFTDVHGTPLDPKTAFEEGRRAASELEEATMKMLKRKK